MAPDRLSLWPAVHPCFSASALRLHADAAAYGMGNAMTMNLRLGALLAATALLSLLTVTAAQSVVSGGGLLAVGALLVVGAPALVALALLLRAAWVDGHAERGHREQVSKLRRIHKQALEEERKPTQRRRRSRKRRS